MSAVFGELSDELVQKSKYAKWRAAYIIKCIKSGEKPLPPEDETKTGQEANNEFNDQPAYNPAEQRNENETQDFDIGQPPAAPNFSDFNLNQINNLTIHSNHPSSATSSHPASVANYSNQIEPSPGASAGSSSANLTLAATNGIKISQDDILKAQKYSKWASSALDYEDVQTAVGNLQKALNILTRGRED